MLRCTSHSHRPVPAHPCPPTHLCVPSSSLQLPQVHRPLTQQRPPQHTPAQRGRWRRRGGGRNQRLSLCQLAHGCRHNTCGRSRVLCLAPADAGPLSHCGGGSGTTCVLAQGSTGSAALQLALWHCLAALLAVPSNFQGASLLTRALTMRPCMVRRYGACQRPKKQLPKPPYHAVLCCTPPTRLHDAARHGRQHGPCQRRRAAAPRPGPHHRAAELVLRASHPQVKDFLLAVAAWVGWRVWCGVV